MIDYVQIHRGLDGGLDEAAYLADEAFLNLFDQDPGLSGADDESDPGWVPLHADVVQANADAPPAEVDGASFDDTAAFVGAFDPQASAPWTAGWTAYPAS